MKRFTVGFMVCLLLTVSYAFSADVVVPEGSRCAECGMKVEAASPFIAVIRTAGGTAPGDFEGTALFFCDIGDMLVYYKKLKEKPLGVSVRDMDSKEWLDAEKAHYVKAGFSTPMGWGIAAFKEEKEAAKAGAPMTFDEALRSLGAPMKMKMHGT